MLVFPIVYLVRFGLNAVPMYGVSQRVDTVLRPGIKFSYNLSPMSVVVTEKRMPFYHFLTSLCAIIGGMYTIFSLLDTFVYHGSKMLAIKTSLGKQG